MALSAAAVDTHIDEWSNRLQSPFFPHRKHWPKHLFHHAPLENAAAILRDGCLRSRTDEANTHPKDVAAPGVIDNRHDAHGRVRLYFRPKTPTQYSIEGIRKGGECRYGDQTHLPLIVMFCLDARAVLLNPEIQFSDKNMQLGSAMVGSTDADFAQIPFAKVYHEGPIGDDRSIIDARCAEVMPSSPLHLAGTLSAISFRSKPERDTLLSMLGEQAGAWRPFCRVSDELKVFQKDYSFISFLELSPEGLIFQLNPRRDGQAVALRALLLNAQGDVMFDNSYASQPAKPPNGGNWIIEKKLSKGRYFARLWIEGHPVYEGPLTLEDELV